MAMDLKDFRFSMKLDWIDLLVGTSERTNFQTVRRKSQVSFVTAVDADPGGSASTFRLRIQEPKSLSHLEAIAAAIPARIDAIVGLELSLDAQHLRNDLDQLAEMADRMYSFLSTPASTNHRFVFGGKRCWFNVDSRDYNRRRLRDGWTLYIGNNRTHTRGGKEIAQDPYSQRIYVKTTDNNTRLRPDQYRARLEWTFCGGGLPFTTMEEASLFTAKQFAAYFKFRRYDDDLPEALALALRGTGQIGAQKPGRGRGGRSGPRKHDPRTRADTKLNARAYDAAKQLVARLRKGFTRAQIPEFQIGQIRREPAPALVTGDQLLITEIPSSHHLGEQRTSDKVRRDFSVCATS